MTDFAENARFYTAADVVGVYAARVALMPAEEKVLARHEGAIRRAALLDVGVGTGRTVPHLRARCRSYTGIDYSPPMIARCRAAFPDAHVLCCNVRDLSPFADGSFDVVSATYNGLDDLGHGDRLRALGEVARVLRRGGLFVFSSHNVGWAHPPGDAHEIRIVSERMMGREWPTYYIGARRQIAQLADAALEIVEVSDAQGELLAELDGLRDACLHYVARRV